MRSLMLLGPLAAALGLGCAGRATPPQATPAAGAGTQPQAGAEDAAYYQQARAVLASGDSTRAKQLDFRRVRRGSMLVNFVAGAGKDGELDRTLEAAIATGESARILATARELLSKDAAYGPAHLVAGAVLQQQGKPAQAELHMAFANGMLDSILGSGDGRTPASAFVVFHVREEYEVARVLRAEVLRQNMRQLGERAYDMLTVRRLPKEGSGPAEGPEREMYFDVTELFALEGKALDLDTTQARQK